MKNTFKKLCAAVLVLLMCLSFVGCYNENDSWAVKKENNSNIPIGGYIYFQYSAYIDARAKVGTDTEVMKATIDDESAETWINNKITDSIKTFYFIEDKFNDLGLTFTDEEIESMKTSTDSTWGYYGNVFEAMGISKASFHLVATEFSAKYGKVFRDIYGKDGEKAVSDDELEKHYENNYLSYEYFTDNKTTLDENGNTVDFTDEEVAEREKYMKDFIAELNSDDKAMTETAFNYQNKYMLENSTYTTSSTLISSVTGDEILTAINDAKENEVIFIDATTAKKIALGRKLPISDKSAEILASDTDRATLLSSFKSDDFADYVEEHAKEVIGYEFNNSAINKAKLSSIIDDSDRNGTSSVVSEDDSSSEYGDGESADE